MAAITGHIGPLAVYFMLTAHEAAEVGTKGIAEDAVEVFCHLVDHLVRIAVKHGAPTDPKRWEYIINDLAALADRLAFERGATTMLH